MEYPGTATIAAGVLSTFFALQAQAQGQVLPVFPFDVPPTRPVSLEKPGISSPETLVSMGRTKTPPLEFIEGRVPYHMISVTGAGRAEAPLTLFSFLTENAPNTDQRSLDGLYDPMTEGFCVEQFLDAGVPSNPVPVIAYDCKTMPAGDFARLVAGYGQDIDADDPEEIAPEKTGTGWKETIVLGSGQLKASAIPTMLQYIWNRERQEVCASIERFDVVTGAIVETDIGCAAMNVTEYATRFYVDPKKAGTLKRTDGAFIPNKISFDR